jgi:hypothetical protein
VIAVLNNLNVCEQCNKSFSWKKEKNKKRIGICVCLVISQTTTAQYGEPICVQGKTEITKASGTKQLKFGREMTCERAGKFLPESM